MDSKTDAVNDVLVGFIQAGTDDGVLVRSGDEYYIIPFEETGCTEQVDYNKLVGRSVPFVVIEGTRASLSLGSSIEALNIALESQPLYSLKDIVIGEHYICLVSGFSSRGLSFNLGGIEGFISKAEFGFPEYASLMFLFELGSRIEVIVNAVDYEKSWLNASISNIEPGLEEPARDIETLSEEEAKKYISDRNEETNTPTDLVSSFAPRCCCIYNSEVFLADVTINVSQRCITVLRYKNNSLPNIFIDFRDRKFLAKTDSGLLYINVDGLELFCYMGRFLECGDRGLQFDEGLGTYIYTDVMVHLKYADLVYGKLIPSPKREKCEKPFYIDNTIRNKYGIVVLQIYHQLIDSTDDTPTMELSNVEYEFYDSNDILLWKGLANLSCKLVSEDDLKDSIEVDASCEIKFSKRKPAILQSTEKSIFDSIDYSTIHPDFIIDEYGKDSLGKRDVFNLVHGLSLAKHLYGSTERKELFFYQNDNHCGGIVLRFQSFFDYYCFGDYIRMVCALFVKVKEAVKKDYLHINIRKANNTPITDEREQGSPDDIKISPDQDNSFKELNSLIGLQEIKHDVSSLVNLIKVQKMRETKGLKAIPVSLHLVFTGNPGTGKTTIARILAQLYKEIGVLKTGQLIEVDRSALVAGYVGQTAIKTQEKINEAIGGILFIDEAYTLAKEGNDFGQEAIDTLLKAMEDRRGEFVVIVAGYEEPMQRFINSNPGLKSRFNKYIRFPDYNSEELIQIFDMMCQKYDYSITSEAHDSVIGVISNIVQNKDTNFANAREIRNLFERIVTKQANRVAITNDIHDNDIFLITSEDVI